MCVKPYNLWLFYALQKFAVGVEGGLGLTLKRRELDDDGDNKQVQETTGVFIS